MTCLTCVLERKLHWEKLKCTITRQRDIYTHLYSLLYINIILYNIRLIDVHIFFSFILFETRKAEKIW